MSVRIKVEETNWDLDRAITAFWAASLLARAGHRIILELPGRAIFVPGLKGTIHEAIYAVIAAFPPQTKPGPSLCATIAPDPTAGDITAWSAGWTVWLGAKSDWKDSNPLSAALAGALLAARVEGALNGEPSRPVVFNLINFSEEIRQGIPPRVVAPATLAGCGAVGSAYALAMAHFTPTTRLMLLDNEDLDETNCIRYITALPGDVETSKAMALAAMLRAAGVDAEGVRQEAVQGTTRAPGLLISTVHEAETRRQLAFNLPRFVIDGAVGPGLIFPWSATAELCLAANQSAACLACFYHEDPLEGAIASFARELDAPVDEISRLMEGDGSVTEALLAFLEERGITGMDIAPGEPISTLRAAYCGAESQQSRHGNDVRPRRIFGPATVGVLLAVFHATDAYRRPGVSVRFDVLYGPSAHNVFSERSQPTCVVCSTSEYQTALDTL